MAVLLIATLATPSVNAMAVGALQGERYVLITQGLADGLTPPQVEAIVFHEMGHFLKHLRPWRWALVSLTALIPYVLTSRAPGSGASGSPRPLSRSTRSRPTRPSGRGASIPALPTWTHRPGLL